VKLLVAAPLAVFTLDEQSGVLREGSGLDGQRPTGIAADPHVAGRAWCCTARGGVFRTDDDGATWRHAGLADERLMTIAASPAAEGLLWAGTEPSAVWRSDDGGDNWKRTRSLDELPSSSEWAFPPRPDTHHVRWIACQPDRPQRLWVAVEAGALITSDDGGRSWRDRVAGGPYDTHELAIHPAAPTTLRVAAGDGYYESDDGGTSWSRPDAGLDIAYMRSVAIDPARADVVIISGASGPRTAYVAGVSDGRIYRREAADEWRPVDDWPRDNGGIAPLLIPGRTPDEFFAADERGVHRSGDGGVNWAMIAPFATTPQHLRGLTLTL
jgi:hypothetical protein